MKYILVILCFVFVRVPGMAQPVFKTVVPQKSLVVGESFQVQYIVTDEDKLSDFNVPEFRNFRKVSGPHIYVGTLGIQYDVQQVQNTVYTLMPLYPGRFLIPGATVVINSKTYRSNDELVFVITREEAIRRSRKESEPAISEYFLRPEEDPYKKIRENLFVRVVVDRRKCFVGQPVVATFKLYSRLQSRSDIIKNPGFYGFTVYDMINLADREAGSEIVNGKTFDVHTIRQVQLYPLREGDFSIDPMEIKNTVEFSRSVVNKKTEQEIAEGLLNENRYTPNDGAEVFETRISTDPIAIEVKSTPVKNRPDSFNGATGRFSLDARIVKDQLARNEQGKLEVVITGKGNFTQLVAPGIQWPAGMEGFEPTVTDMLDRSSIPLAGKRIFHYSFVSAKEGEYIIPAIQFAYLNPDSGRYNVISTPALKVSISANEKLNPAANSNQPPEKENRSIYWILALSIAGIGLLSFLFRRKLHKPEMKTVSLRPEELTPGIKDHLSVAYLLASEEDSIFYSALRHAIWQFFSNRFKWSGSQLKKQALLQTLGELNVDPVLVHKLNAILDQCEAGMYTSVELGSDKADMVHETEVVLREISEKLL